MSRLRTRLALTVSAIFAVLAMAWFLPLGDWLEAAGDWGRANPVPGTLVYVAVFAVASVFLVPGSWIAMAGGYLYGLETGAALAIAGGGAGATAAFLNARTLARGWALGMMQSRPDLLALDRALGEETFLLVLLSRLSLLIPYNLLNYFYGVTAVRAVPYAIASAIGLIPAMIFYTYVGTLAGDMEALWSGEIETGLAGRIYIVAGLAAAILVIVFVHRIATRALRARMES